MALALLFLPAPAQAAPAPRVIVAVLPNGTGPVELGRVPGISPGLMSAGLGAVAAEQTYLDITQGNRVFSGLYNDDLPFVLPSHGRIRHWGEIVRRAESAPAKLVPGLLGSTFERAHPPIPARADPELLTPALVVANEHGRFSQARGFCGIRSRCPPGLTIEPAFLDQLPALIRGLRNDDLLIAFERAPPESHHGLALGVAGAGFSGNLVSGSTRLRGMVLSTDVAPTVLRRFRLPVPDEMLGEEIHSEGDVDAGALTALDARLARIVPRRGAVIGGNVFLWILAATAAAVTLRGRRARTAFALLGLACIYIPALLLLGAALEPSRFAERAIVGVGGPLLAALTLRLAPGYRGFATACAVTVGAYAIDMLAGSVLTPLSLMGPNPALGVRFYGIGNELEATLSTMLVLGTGAALACVPGWSRRRQAATFIGIAVIGSAIFAAGRFGADVGAAIVFPVAGATAALYTLGVRGRRFALLVVAAPLAGLLALIALELVLGGDSHLTRSVLRAGETEDLLDVASRRLRASAGSFSKPVNGSFLVLAIALLLTALAFRRRIVAWFEGRAPALAGLLGAVAATAVGALANDSGALVLIIGTGVLTAYACFAWSQAPPTPEVVANGTKPTGD